MKGVRFVLTLVMLLALPGCSFLFMDRVPDDYAQRSDFTCTTNRAAPGLDLLGAAMFASVGVLWLAFASAFDTQDDVALGSLIFFAPAAIAGGSAAVGFSQAGDCERAIDDLERRSRERRAVTAPTSTTGTVSEPAICTFDTQCGGARLCVANRCVDPQPTVAPPAPSAPPATVAP